MLPAATDDLQRACALSGLELADDGQGLALTDGTMSVRGDFSKLARRATPASLPRELLVRACKLKGNPAAPRAIDATAGLGEDAFILAAAGFDVALYEKNPIVAALLDDALERARLDEGLASIARRMHLELQDSVAALRNAPNSVEVVFLDPMFPEKTKTACAKKKLQILQHLESPCEEEAALLEAAMGAATRKVVVKRPIKGPHLAGMQPGYTLSGKAVRYDCYVL